MKLLLNPEYNLYEKGGEPYCDSLMLAESFNKRHDHILRDTENALATIAKTNRPKFGEINFMATSYKDSKNRKQPKYLYAKDGFAYLVFGFEGEKAAEIKIDYITRFNQMESFIQSLLTTKIEFPAFTEAVMLAHDEPKHYHYSNEINMIYRIVLGVDAKKYREQNGIPAGEVIKPFLTLEQIKAVETLQRVDIGLLEAGIEYEKRKEQLTESYRRRTRLLAG